MNDVYDPKSLDLHNSIAPLVSQVRMAVLSGVDQEFLRDKELAALEVTSAQFVIIANVLKGHANSACELCKYMDYDRGAMSRMIDRLESFVFARARQVERARGADGVEVRIGRQALRRIAKRQLRSRGLWSRRDRSRRGRGDDRLGRRW